MSEFTTRVFVSGKLEEIGKGKVTHSISQHIKAIHEHTFDANQFMDKTKWEAGKFDGVDGYYVNIHYDYNGPAACIAEGKEHVMPAGQDSNKIHRNREDQT